MNKKRTAAALIAAGLLAATLVPGPAGAASPAACSLSLASFVASTGDQKFQTITATSPVTATNPVVGPKGLFPGDQVKLASSLGWEPDPPSGYRRSGYV